mgnify:CR=1 FL=1
MKYKRNNERIVRSIQVIMSRIFVLQIHRQVYLINRLNVPVHHKEVEKCGYNSGCNKIINKKKSIPKNDTELKV